MRKRLDPSMKAAQAHPWMVLAGLALGVTVTNSFARFAYGLILPAMKSEMAWTYAQAGWLNTANALGYIVGAVITMLFDRASLAHAFVCLWADHHHHCAFGHRTERGSLVANHVAHLGRIVRCHVFFHRGCFGGGIVQRLPTPQCPCHCYSIRHRRRCRNCTGWRGPAGDAGSLRQQLLAYGLGERSGRSVSVSCPSVFGRQPS